MCWSTTLESRGLAAKAVALTVLRYQTLELAKLWEPPLGLLLNLSGSWSQMKKLPLIMMDDSSETMDHNNASFASMEPVAANKKECLL